MTQSTTSYSDLKIKSIKHNDIQELIVECCEEMKSHPKHIFRGVTIAEWLEMMGYDKIKHENEEDSYRLGILNVCEAARLLNVIKWEEEGIHDYIGQHFEEWTKNSKYKIYPDEYTKGPGGSKLNRKPTFTKELLELCRKADNRYCEDKLALFNGKYAVPELQLVDLSTVHNPFKDVINNETGKRDFNRGFQTRTDEDYDKDTVSDIKEDIENYNWDPHTQQVALFVLPKKYRYTDEKSQREVVFGVANGNHRITAALEAGEQFIIAWVIEIPFTSLREWATAVGNAPGKSCNPRKKADVVQAIVEAIERNETKFAKELNEASDNDKSQVTPLLENYLKDIYSIRTRQIPGYIKSILDSSGIKSEYRHWTVKEFVREIKENTDTYAGWKQDDKKDHHFEHDGVLNIIVKDDTTQYHNLVFELAEEIMGKNRPTDIIVLPPKGVKFDKQTRGAVRSIPQKKVMENFFEVYQAGEMLFGKTPTAHMPKYKGAPQFDDETTFTRVF